MPAPILPDADLLAGFDDRLVPAGEVRIRVRTAGAGPAVLMLHGYPQDLGMWHRVAPALATDHRVILADLRGYGGSDKPAGGGDHARYAKRAMAADLVAVLDSLGVDRVVVVGHDRGGRVAHRFALDHAERLAGVAFLDILPTLAMFERVDRAMAAAYFHWFFLARPAPLPERLIGADPDAWLDSRFTGRHAGGMPFDPRAIEAYRSAFHDPAMIHASCEDYRAAATIDLEHDRADREAGRRIEVPALVAWGEHGYVGRHHDPLEVWRAYVAGSLVGRAIDADHYLAEEAPAATIAAIRGLLDRPEVMARRR